MPAGRCDTSPRQGSRADACMRHAWVARGHSLFVCAGVCKVRARVHVRVWVRRACAPSVESFIAAFLRSLLTRR